MKPALVLFVACLLSGVALPMPEDVPLLTAGATLDGPGAFAVAVLAGGLGVLGRDTLYFAVGRLAGEGLLRRRLVRALLGPRRLARARASVRRRGARAVLLARCAVGFRGVSFLVAGALGVRARDFFAWDLLGIAVTVPLTLVIGRVFGPRVLDAAAWASEHTPLLLAFAAVLVVAWVTRDVGSPSDAGMSELDQGMSSQSA